MSHFKSKTMRGVVYDLTHLDPMQFHVTHNDKTFAVRAIFSCHCFTEELDPAVHTPDYHYVHEAERRAFSIVRYYLSKQLPALISALGAGTVYHSNIGNYFLLRQNAAVAHPGTYVVFFNVIRATKDNTFDVVMYVQSAYLKPNMADWASPIRFATLVDFTARGLKPPQGKRMQIKRK